MKIHREIFFLEKQIWCQDKTVEEETKRDIFPPDVHLWRENRLSFL